MSALGWILRQTLLLPLHLACGVPKMAESDALGYLAVRFFARALTLESADPDIRVAATRARRAPSEAGREYEFVSSRLQ